MRGRILEEGVRKVPQRSPVHQQEGRRKALTLLCLIVAMEAASVPRSNLKATLLGDVSIIPKSMCLVFQS
jgi:hypothetical protein